MITFHKWFVIFSIRNTTIVLRPCLSWDGRFKIPERNKGSWFGYHNSYKVYANKLYKSLQIWIPYFYVRILRKTSS